jgi:hypothetical protein
MFARRTVLFVSAALALLLPCTGRAGQPLQIGAPEGNTLASMAQAVLRQAYARLDIELKTQVLRLRRALLMAESGELDGDLMRNAGVLQNSPSLLKVRVPVAVAVYSACRRGDCPPRASLEQLGQSRVAYSCTSATPSCNRGWRRFWARWSARARSHASGPPRKSGRSTLPSPG